MDKIIAKLNKSNKNYKISYFILNIILFQEKTNDVDDANESSNRK